MLVKKSLKQIPSSGEYHQFKEFTNEYLDLMMNTQESITDNIYTQFEILKDSSDINVEKLTMIDVFFIFLHWRWRCVGSDLELGNSEGETVIDLTEWFSYLDKLLLLETEKIISVNINGHDSRICVDVPLYESVKDVYTNTFHISNEDKRNFNIEHDLNNASYIRRIDYGGCDDGWVDVTEYGDKLNIFNNLPKGVYEEIDEHISHINKSIDILDFSFDINGASSKITIGNIPQIIRIMFMSSIDGYDTKYIFLSNKRGVSYDYYKSMTPLRTDSLFYGTIEELKNEQGGDMDELISPN